MAYDAVAEKDKPILATGIPASAPTAAPSSAEVSVPLEPNPGLIENIRKFTVSSLADFYYNAFRFIGYVAQAVYSIVLRYVTNKRYGESEAKKLTFEPAFWRPDFLGGKGAGSRMILHGIECAAFEGLAVGALFQDKKRFRAAVRDVVAAESGKDPAAITLKDILANRNPIIQTAANRSKGLYAMRLAQPFTFLWSLGVGLVFMAFEIVGERSAYLEKNAYDKLQLLMKEVQNNQLGAWSREDVTARLVEVIQQSRAEHSTPAIVMRDVENYFPLLHQITDRILEKKWRLPEAIYVLGQIVKEPADLAKAQKAYDDVLAKGLSGIAAQKREEPPAVSVPAPDAPGRQSSPAAIQKILAQGQRTALAEPATTELSLAR